MHMVTFCAEACGDSDESWFLVISIFWQWAGLSCCRIPFNSISMRLWTHWTPWILHVKHPDENFWDCQKDFAHIIPTTRVSYSSPAGTEKERGTLEWAQMGWLVGCFGQNWWKDQVWAVYNPRSSLFRTWGFQFLNANGGVNDKILAVGFSGDMTNEDIGSEIANHQPLYLI